MEKIKNPAELKGTSNFWFYGALLAVLLVCTEARDITRPFYGLHSWSEASIAWRSRVYFNYPVSYHKFLSTWAVGQPPSPAKPNHYLDHPQLGMLLRAADMVFFGINEYAQRIGSIIRELVCLLLLLVILRGLTQQRVALLACLLYVLFPLSQYFPVRDWGFPLGLLATWFYLRVIRAFKDCPEPKRRHFWGLALSLFFVIQMTWSGFFYAMAVGIHYVFRCIRRKQRPAIGLLAILIVAPFLSMLINFTIMAAGHNWDISKIVDLYKWRAGSGELKNLTWAKWCTDYLWGHAVTNFTIPVLAVAIAYLTFGQLVVLANRPTDERDKDGPEPLPRFPQFWLFLMPGVFQLLLLRGTLPAHQYWERPLAPFVAIAAALGVILVVDLVKKVNRKLSLAAGGVLMCLFLVFCIKGTNFYYYVRWQRPEKIEMFKLLHDNIPPDKALLSYEDFIVEQHKAKGAFYRPEIAWYLDRPIVQAGAARNRGLPLNKALSDIEQKAATGEYPYYLVPRMPALMPLINELAKRYEVFRYIPGKQPEVDLRRRTIRSIRAGMYPYVIFDLRKKPGSGA